jgi:hypothetical protein
MRKLWIQKLCIFALGVFAGVSILWIGSSVLVTAQGSKSANPEGFEFSTTTPVIRYHYPKSDLRTVFYKGTWIAENVDGVTPDFVIDAAETRLTTEPVAYFSLSKPKADWPIGQYRLEISANNLVVHTERFIIK